MSSVSDIAEAMFIQSASQSILEKRTSVGKYDKNRSIEASQVTELVRLACLAPSAFNLQNWEFVAVHSEQAKQTLFPLAFFQPQVLDASVTFIVCGNTDGYKQLEVNLQASVEADIISLGVQKAWVDMATKAHEEDSQARRDEAIRSASLAAMSLMVAAQEMGMVSGAMGGFDTGSVKASFDISEENIPVMLVTVGYPAEGNWPQKLRRPVGQVLNIV